MWTKRLLIVALLAAVAFIGWLIVVPSPTDEKSLAQVAISHKRADKRLEAAEKLTDQEALALVAKNQNEVQAVRLAAVAKLTDQAVLADLAKRVDDDMRNVVEKRLAELRTP